jgi:hypothetical protein
VDAAWNAYSHSRKAPLTRKAGPGFADPKYELAVDWLAAREAILAAQRRHDDAAERPRILIINGSSRSEHTCPGEMSKSWRLVKLAEPAFVEMGLAVDILGLSRLTSEFGKQIHPCKSCVSTSPALWHPDRVACELVSCTDGAEGDDRPDGLRRWLQSRSDLHPWQTRG